MLAWTKLLEPKWLRSVELYHFASFFALTWAKSEGHPHTEGTFTGTLLNVCVCDLRRNSGDCPGVTGSPKFAKLRQTSPKFEWRRTHASGTPWNLPDSQCLPNYLKYDFVGRFWNSPHQRLMPMWCLVVIFCTPKPSSRGLSGDPHSLVTK